MTRSRRFQDHVSGGNEGQEGLAAGHVFDVDDDGPLVGAKVLMDTRPFGATHSIEERTEVPRRAAKWRFDEDDLGAKVGQDPACERCRLVCEVEHADAFEATDRWTAHRGISMSATIAVAPDSSTTSTASRTTSSSVCTTVAVGVICTSQWVGAFHRTSSRAP